MSEKQPAGASGHPLYASEELGLKHTLILLTGSDHRFNLVIAAFIIVLIMVP